MRTNQKWLRLLKKKIKEATGECKKTPKSQQGHWHGEKTTWPFPDAMTNWTQLEPTGFNRHWGNISHPPQ